RRHASATKVPTSGPAPLPPDVVVRLSPTLASAVSPATPRSRKASIVASVWRVWPDWNGPLQGGNPVLRVLPFARVSGLDMPTGRQLARSQGRQLRGEAAPMDRGF